MKWFSKSISLPLIGLFLVICKKFGGYLGCLISEKNAFLKIEAIEKQANTIIGFSR
jgi:hypothetical protein